MKKHLAIFTIISSLLFFNFCSMIFGNFRLTDSSHKVSPGSMAVIAGTAHESMQLFALKMTEEFRQQTRFRPVSQSKIKSAYPAYPFEIKGPFKKTYTKAIPDFSQIDHREITRIAQKLGVQYIYIFWVPSITIWDKCEYVAPVYHQVFAFPGCREVGNGQFDLHWLDGCFGVGVPKSYNEATVYFSKGVVKDIANKFNVFRETKK